jgi:hypothetical protein
MARWLYKVSIRRYLDVDGESQEDMVRAAKGIRGEVAKLPGGLALGAKPLLDKLDNAATANELDWFNASLERLWDWFDENRVWAST